MSGHINGANILDIYHGNDYIESVYKGSDLIFDNSDILKKYVEGRTSFVVPKETTSLRTTCFYGWDTLKTIKFEEPCQITSLNDDCFYNCSSLQSITIPNSVQSIGGQCFIGNISLNTVVFEEPCQITELPRICFRECESLTEITIPSSVTTIDSNCFGDSYEPNTTLTTIYINKPTDSIAGAPWGATNATVIWNDDYSEDERGDSEPQA